MRINSYYIPNRSLSSYIPGKTKTGNDSCLVRGFWGDMVNSPFIGFGVELNNQEEHDLFYSHQDVNYKFHAQHITEWNLSRYLTRIEKDELFELKNTDHKIRQNSNIEKNEKPKTDEIENKIDDLDLNKKSDEKIKDESIVSLTSQGDEKDKINVLIKEINKDSIILTDENTDKTLLGFENFDMKLILVTGEIDQFFKKKK